MLTVENYIELNGKDVKMSSLTAEERKELGAKAKETFFKTLGFVPVKDKKDKTA